MTTSKVLNHIGGLLVIPPTVLVHQYWQEIPTGLDNTGVPVRHAVLHAERRELIQRISADTVESSARQWHLDRLDSYEAARSWQSQQAHVIDTTGLQPPQVAKLVAADERTTARR